MKNLFSIILLVLTINAFSQNQIELPLGTSQVEVRNLFEWNNKGVVLFTGLGRNRDDRSKDQEEKVTLLTNDMKVKWEKKLIRKQANVNQITSIISSDNFIYVLCPKRKGSMLTAFEGYYLTQIDENGNIKEIETDNVLLKQYFEPSYVPFELRDFYTNTTFSTSNKLYFPYKEQSTADQKVSEYQMYVLDETSLQFTNVNVELPKVNSEGSNYFNGWIFFGEVNDTIYYYTKEVVFGKNKSAYNYRICKVGLNGKLIKEFIINAQLKNQKFPAPSVNPNIGQYTFNHFTELSNVDRRGSVSPNSGNFGDIAIDKKNKEFFIFGFYNAEFNSGTFEGVFIQKYNLEGEKEWLELYPFSTDMTESNPWVSKSLFSEKHTSFTLIPENLVLFSFHNAGPFRKSAYNHFIISSNGKLKETVVQKYPNVSPGMNKMIMLKEEYKDNKKVELGIMQGEKSALIFKKDSKMNLLTIFRVL